MIGDSCHFCRSGNRNRFDFSLANCSSAFKKSSQYIEVRIVRSRNKRPPYRKADHAGVERNEQISFWYQQHYTPLLANHLYGLYVLEKALAGRNIGDD